MASQPPPPSPSLHSRIEASLLCLAVTDALGAPLEFGPRIWDPSQHITTMLRNENFRLPPGHFTDDTSMALCLATSLLDSQGRSDALSQADMYCQWAREGRMSSLPGRCFDIGLQTDQTLKVWGDVLRDVRTGAVGGSSDNNDDKEGEVDRAVAKALAVIAKDFNYAVRCGNGSLMRVLPCALVATSEEHAVQLARESSLVTHPHPRCVDSCIVYTRMVFNALHGATKQELFSILYNFMHDAHSDGRDVDPVLRDQFKDYASIESFERKPLVDISSSGYVVHSLEAALWAFFTTTSYRDGAIKVVNLGNDADTVGAIFGGLAGAFYGAETEIPKEWLDQMQALNIVREVIARILHEFHPTTAA